MGIDKAYMKMIAEDYGFYLEQKQLEQLDLYADILVDWNEKINLTAITEPQEIAIKHFLDSMLLLKSIDVPDNISMIDVGTGAGFPSLPVKIVREDINVTLLDSLNKRVKFLETLCSEIQLDSKAVHGRAEEMGRKQEYREQFDIATARAVANLAVLCEYCLPFVKVGGVFIALKGSDANNETEQAKGAIHILGAKIEDIKEMILPDGSSRGIVIIRKISQTPTKYPRQSAKISKNPLS
ncbi:MAG: methyltransferase GidB [Oscillospiraceae bacterium]|jgi:16S rRNA (guanine(527)-N(7))-methyltransferase RsmG|nr:methyltransferase GidB [Oscillospiraceae bacterium]